jgi:hypothetical protein
MPSTRRMLETAPPLTQEEYARSRLAFAEVGSSNEHEVLLSMAKRFITENKFDKNPIRLLDIGAGRGDLEIKLVKDLGLKLDYVCAIEPISVQVKELKIALDSLGTP